MTPRASRSWSPRIPALATVRDRDGVSAIMRSRYRFDRATTDALLAVDPDLDVFEATALGYIDRLRERLDEDPARALAFSADGFTALHFAAFFGKAEAARLLLSEGAAVGAVSRNEMARPASPLGRGRAPSRGLPRPDRGRRRCQRDAAERVHATPRRGPARRRRAGRAAPVGRRRPDGADRGRRDARRHGRAAGHVDVARRIRQVAEERAGVAGWPRRASAQPRSR